MTGFICPIHAENNKPIYHTQITSKKFPLHKSCNKNSNKAFHASALFNKALTSASSPVNTNRKLSTPRSSAADFKKISILSPIGKHDKKFYPIINNNMNLISLITRSSPYFILISLGAGGKKINKTDDVALTNTITNRYEGNRTLKWTLLSAIGFGRHFKSSKRSFIDLGVTGYYFNFGRHHGILHPAYNISPNFDTLNYKFLASSIALWSELHCFLSNNRFKPYFFLGIGAAWNHLYNYRESPSDPNKTAAPMLNPFANHWKTNFSFGLGLGIAQTINQRPRWSIEYRYANLGKAEFAQTPLQTTLHRLQVGSLNVNLVMLSFYIK